MKSEIKVGDGKYTLQHNHGIGLKCLRYDEPWRDLVGDGMVLALVQRIEALEDSHKELLSCLKDVYDGRSDYWDADGWLSHKEVEQGKQAIEQAEKLNKEK